MILHRKSVPVTDQGKEVIGQGGLLKLAANDNDLHQYPAGVITAHWHPEMEVFSLRSGRVRVNAGSESCELGPGEGCFLNAEVVHSFQALGRGECRFQSFVFDPAIVGGLPGSVFDVKFVRPLLDSGVPFLKLDRGDRPFFSALAAGIQACREEAPGFELALRDALSQAVLYVGGRCDFQERKAPSVQEERLKEMLLWIDGHLEEPMGAADLAAAGHVSLRECQRVFRRYLGCSPVEYLRRRRLLRAAELLRTTQAPVTDIALGCGFGTPSYFTGEFKKLMGKTPRQYRKDASRDDGTGSPGWE